MIKILPKIGLDADDVLLSCIPHAIDIANMEYNYCPKLIPEEVTGWGITGRRSDVILQYFEKESFFKSQPVIEGAQDFVKKLCKMAEVFVITSIPQKFASIRIQQILKYFPEISIENILIGSRKDIVKMDLILDDGAHNITKSSATYPVLMRKPWNRHLSGLLSISRYDDFLHLVKRITTVDKPVNLKQGGVVVLCGPSGSGKTEFAESLSLKSDKYFLPNTYTTKASSPQNYISVSSETFYQLKNKGKITESTVYAGFDYGLSLETLEKKIDHGNIGVVKLDICGALTLKQHFSSKCLLVYVHRSKKDIIKNIISNNDLSTDEITARILSIDSEKKNRCLCDEVWEYTDLQHIIQTFNE